MTSIVLTRHIGYLRTILPASRLSYHAGKAASVNTAIARGIRKSKGLALRGSPFKERKPDDPRQQYIERNGLVSRDAESGRRTQEDRPKAKNRDGGRDFIRDRDATDDRSTAKEMKIRRGIKLVKTDQELARKKPDPAGHASKGRFAYGKQGGPRTPFDDERNSGSLARQAGRRTFESKDTPNFNPRHPHHFHNPPPRESLPESYGERRRNASSPRSSSSTRDSTYQKRQWELRPMEIAEGRGRFKSGRNSSTTESGDPSHIRRTWGPKGMSELTEGLDRDDAAPRDVGGRPYKQNNPEARSGSDRRDSGRIADNDNSAETENRFSMTRREKPPTTPRIAKIDPRIPLSIPYTTPASEFLYGTSVVEAALTSTRIPRRQLYKLYIYTGENRERSSSDRDVDLEALARSNGVKVSRVSGDGLRLMDKMSGGRPHNGYILEASPLPRLPITSLGSVVDEDGRRGFNVTVDVQSREDAAVNGTADFINLPRARSGRKPMVLLLDSIQDPGNLGGIIRTASFLGASAVAISTRNSASFTPVVLKASAGASENITLFSISKPEAFVQESREAGWKIYAAVAPSAGKDAQRSGKSISTDELDDPLVHDPCVLMLGGEGDGLRMNLRRKADVKIYIPGRAQKSMVDSLNVSVAAGILTNSFLGQSRKSITPLVDEAEVTEKASEKSSNDLF